MEDWAPLAAGAVMVPLVALLPLAALAISTMHNTAERAKAERAERLGARGDAQLRPCGGAVAIADAFAKPVGLAARRGGGAAGTALPAGTPVRVLDGGVPGLLLVESAGSRGWCDAEAVLRGCYARSVCPAGAYACAVSSAPVPPGAACALQILRRTSNMVVGVCTAAAAASMKAGGVQKLESLEGCECAVASSGAVLRGQTWRPGPAAGFKAGDLVTVELHEGGQRVEFTTSHSASTRVEGLQPPDELFLFVAIGAAGDAVALLRSFNTAKAPQVPRHDAPQAASAMELRTPQKSPAEHAAISPAFTPPTYPAELLLPPKPSSHGALRFESTRRAERSERTTGALAHGAGGDDESVATPLLRRRHAPAMPVSWSNTTAVPRAAAGYHTTLWSEASARAVAKASAQPGSSPGPLSANDSADDAGCNDAGLLADEPLQRRAWHTESVSRLPEVSTAPSLTRGASVRTVVSSPLPSVAGTVVGDTASDAGSSSTSDVGAPLLRGREGTLDKAQPGTSGEFVCTESCSAEDDVPALFWESVPSCGQCESERCEDEWCRGCLGWLQAEPDAEPQPTVSDGGSDEASCTVEEAADAKQGDSPPDEAPPSAPPTSPPAPDPPTGAGTQSSFAFGPALGSAPAAPVAPATDLGPITLVPASSSQPHNDDGVSAMLKAAAALADVSVAPAEVAGHAEADAGQVEDTFDPFFLVPEPSTGEPVTMSYRQIQRALETDDSWAAIREGDILVRWQYIDSNGVPRDPDPEKGIDPTRLPEYSLLRDVPLMMQPEYFVAETQESAATGPFTLLELKQHYLDGRVEMESLVCGPTGEKDVPPPSLAPEVWDEVHVMDDIWADLVDDEEPQEEEQEAPMDPKEARRAVAVASWGYIEPLSSAANSGSNPTAELTIRACKELAWVMSPEWGGGPEWAGGLVQRCVRKGVHRSLLNSIHAAQHVGEDTLGHAIKAVACLVQPTHLKNTEEGAALATPEAASVVLKAALRFADSKRVVAYAARIISGMIKLGKISTPENKADWKVRCLPRPSCVPGPHIAAAQQAVQATPTYQGILSQQRAQQAGRAPAPQPAQSQGALTAWGGSNR